MKYIVCPKTRNRRENAHSSPYVNDAHNCHPLSLAVIASVTLRPIRVVLAADARISSTITRLMNLPMNHLRAKAQRYV